MTLAQAVGQWAEAGLFAHLGIFQLHARTFPGPEAPRMAVSGHGEAILERKVMVTSQRHHGMAGWEGGNAVWIAP